MIDCSMDIGIHSRKHCNQIRLRVVFAYSPAQSKHFHRTRTIKVNGSYIANLTMVIRTF